MLNKFKYITEWLKEYVYYPIRYQLSTFKYWVRCQIQRPHILDLRSPHYGYRWGWIDPCDKVLVACFNILVRFVEDEVPYVKTKAKLCAEDREIKKLYIWWTKTRPSLEEKRVKIMELHGHVFDSTLEPVEEEGPNGKVKLWKVIFDDSKEPQRRAVSKALLFLEQKIQSQDDKMLVQLMKIRNKLWT